VVVVLVAARHGSTISLGYIIDPIEAYTLLVRNAAKCEIPYYTSCIWGEWVVEEYDIL